MKKLVLIDVNEKLLKKTVLSNSKILPKEYSLDHAIYRELGWVNESGISIEFVYDANMEKSYFDLISIGHDPFVKTERVEINVGKNGKILIDKMEEGITVNIYGQEDLVSSTYVYESEMNPVK